MFVIADGVYKTRTHRILQDISRKYPDVIIWSEDKIVVSLLPEPSSVGAGVASTRALFRNANEPTKIRVWSKSLDEHAQVFRHQAVRENCKLIFGRR
jgi:hypothetical protein